MTLTNRTKIGITNTPHLLVTRFGQPTKLQSWFTTCYFFFVLIFLFGLSGVLEMVTRGVYRQSYAVLLLVPLFVLYLLYFDTAIFLTIFTVVSIFFAALLGNSALSNTVLFVRGPISAYVIYHVVRGWLGSHPQNSKFLWRFLFVIGAIQLPIILVQRVFWREMAEYIPTGLTWAVDAGFGTFPVKADYSMAFFLIMLILVLMYSKFIFISHVWRWFLIIFYSLTVLTANSQISHVGLMVVWLAYMLRHLNLRTILTIALAGVLISVGLYFFWEAGWMPLDVSATFRAIQQQLGGTETTSGFARGATLRFFLTEPISWFGKGPGFYFDVAGRQVQGLDVQGHLLLYYAEVGFVGVILSYSLLWSMAYPIRKSTLRLQIMPFLAFLIISIMSITTQVLSQLPIVAIYVLTVSLPQMERVSFLTTRYEQARGRFRTRYPHLEEQPIGFPENSVANLDT